MKFIKKLPFIVQLLIALISVTLGIVGIAYYLDSYTNHGKTAKVPKITGIKLPEAIKKLKDLGFDYQVDSTYMDSLTPLLVVKQYPQDGSMVKDGRTIQLIVNKSTPPQIGMPALVGVRLSSALQYLDRNNLKLEDTIFKPDFATGRVLQQLVNGKEIKPGTMIGFGTKVTLVVSGGLGDIIYNYPDLYGKTLTEAYTLLDQLGLSRGALSKDNDVKDSSKAFVYKQYPEYWDYNENKPTLIRQGNVVDLFISSRLKPKEVDTSRGVLLENAEFRDMQRAEDDLQQYETGALDAKEGKGKKKQGGQKAKSKTKTTTKPAASAGPTNNGNDY